MRKILLYAFALVMLVSLVSAASVSRNMPSRISPGEDLAVVFDVSSAETGKSFTLEDTVPANWDFKSWEVTGAQESKDKINHRFVDGTRHGWVFTASSSNLQIKYVLAVPSNAEFKSYPFSAVYFDASGFQKSDASVLVRQVSCGDSVCEGSENTDNCIADCPKPAPATQPAETTASAGEKKEGQFDPLPIVIVAVIVVVGVIAYFLFFRKKR